MASTGFALTGPNAVALTVVPNFPTSSRSFFPTSSRSFSPTASHDAALTSSLGATGWTQPASPRRSYPASSLTASPSFAPTTSPGTAQKSSNGVALTIAGWPEWWTGPAVTTLGPDWLHADPESSDCFTAASQSPLTTEGANEWPPRRATSTWGRGSSVPLQGGHTPRAPPTVPCSCRSGGH
jgi:hypothetical protein